MRLNLGSGEHNHDGWVNIDTVIRAEGLNLRADVLTLPIRPASCERIYAGHLIEHLEPAEASAALLHWLSLLKVGGELGVMVPDTQRFWAIYERGGFSIEDMSGCIGHGRDPDDPYALHLTVWTEAQLAWFVQRETGRRVEPMVLADWPCLNPESDWQVGVIVRA